MAQNGTSQMQHGWDVWRKLVEDQMQRLGTMVTELDQLEQRRAEQTASAVDEYAKLVKESFAYATHLSAEWRRLTLESARQATEAATTHAPKA